MTGNFNQRLKGGETLLGTMVTIGAAEVAEILVGIGFDWLFVDGEHGPIEVAELQRILQAVSDRTPVLVRVPAIDEVPIKKALDLGVHGIIVPQVSTVEQVKQVVRFTRYPPLGGRGVGMGRAHGYGANFEEYIKVANDRLCVVVQAEHLDAVENIERIIEVEGFDAVLVGPYDLSASMGRMGEVNHPQVVKAIEHVAEVCRTAKIPLGIFGSNAEAVRPYMDRGFNLIVASVDTMLLSEASKKLLMQLRETNRGC